MAPLVLVHNNSLMTFKAVNSLRLFSNIILRFYTTRSSARQFQYAVSVVYINLHRHSSLTSPAQPAHRTEINLHDKKGCRRSQPSKSQCRIGRATRSQDRCFEQSLSVANVPESPASIEQNSAAGYLGLQIQLIINLCMGVDEAGAYQRSCYGLRKSFEIGRFRLEKILTSAATAASATSGRGERW
jgi:hypothetical protein